jgi:hypothetical protein
MKAGRSRQLDDQVGQAIQRDVVSLEWFAFLRDLLVDLFVYRILILHC